MGVGTLSELHEDKSCVICGEPLEARYKFCPMCGRLTALPAPGAEPGPPPKPNVLLEILAIPGMLIGAFLVVVVVITYYAGVASVALMMGAPLIVGIVLATVILFGVVGLAAWMFLRGRAPKKAAEGAAHATASR